MAFALMDLVSQLVETDNKVGGGIWDMVWNINVWALESGWWTWGSCVTVNKLINLSVLQFLHLSTGEDKNSYFVGLL